MLLLPPIRLRHCCRCYFSVVDENKKVFVLTVINLKVLLFSWSQVRHPALPFIFKFVCTIRYAAISIHRVAHTQNGVCVEFGVNVYSSAIGGEWRPVRMHPHTATQMHWRWMMVKINREDRWRMEKRRKQRLKRWKTNRHERHTIQWTSWRKNNPTIVVTKKKKLEVKVISTFRAATTANNGNTWNVNGRNENNLRESEPGEFHELRTIQHHRDREREWEAKGVRKNAFL